jgi:hypothetical protein
MELSFANQAHREVCANEAKAVQQYGALTAAKLRARLEDLRAVDYMHELRVGCPSIAGVVGTISLSKDFELYVECYGIPANGTWKNAERLKILDIRKK